MATAATVAGPARRRRRDVQKEETRLDLAIAAYELARVHGVGHVRVPQIAEAAGVSPRTFNNYFSSKEAAIAWPATLRAQRLADDLAGRPAGQALGEALADAFGDLYERGVDERLPDGWLDGFRALVAGEPGLHGEYLKVRAAGERSLAEAIAVRTGAGPEELAPVLLAGVVHAAERAALLHWVRASPAAGLVEVLRATIRMAVGGIAAAAVPLR